MLSLKQETNIIFSGVKQGNKEIIYVLFDTSLPKMERYTIVQSLSESPSERFDARPAEYCPDITALADWA